MGSSASKKVVYSVQHSETNPTGESEIYRNEITAKKELISSNKRGDTNVQVNFGNMNRKCF